MTHHLLRSGLLPLSTLPSIEDRAQLLLAVFRVMQLEHSLKEKARCACKRANESAAHADRAVTHARILLRPQPRRPMQPAPPARRCSAVQDRTVSTPHPPPAPLAPPTPQLPLLLRLLLRKTRLRAAVTQSVAACLYMQEARVYATEADVELQKLRMTLMPMKQAVLTALALYGVLPIS